MSLEKQPNDLKLKVFPILQDIFEKKILYRGRIAGETIAELFGISNEEAMRLVIEFTDAKQKNRLPGGTIALPEPRQLAEKDHLTEFEVSAGWFTLAYVEETLGLKQQYPLGLLYFGQWWLGNDDRDTKKLVGWMKKNPEGVANYLEWALGPEPDQDSLAQKFRARARNGKLKEPKFE